MKLLYMDELYELAEAVATANALTDADCLGLLIVSPAGHGKSALIRMFAEYPACEIVSDISPWGVKKFAKSQSRGKNKIKTILIPDFNIVLSQRNERTVALMDAALAEGLQSSYTRNLQMKLAKPVRFGWIAACTPEYFLRSFNWLHALGFMDRTFVYLFDYTDEQLGNIINSLIKLSHKSSVKVVRKIVHPKTNIYKGKTRLTPVRLPNIFIQQIPIYFKKTSPRQVSNFLLLLRGYRTANRYFKTGKLLYSPWLATSIKLQSATDRSEIMAVFEKRAVVK